MDDAGRALSMSAAAVSGSAVFMPVSGKKDQKKDEQKDPPGIPLVAEQFHHRIHLQYRADTVYVRRAVT